MQTLQRGENISKTITYYTGDRETNRFQKQTGAGGTNALSNTGYDT
jgi:hypothetical protein